jgi:hypothetical protein
MSLTDNTQSSVFSDISSVDSGMFSDDFYHHVKKSKSRSKQNHPMTNRSRQYSGPMPLDRYLSRRNKKRGEASRGGDSSRGHHRQPSMDTMDETDEAPSLRYSFSSTCSSSSASDDDSYASNSYGSSEESEDDDVDSSSGYSSTSCSESCTESYTESYAEPSNHKAMGGAASKSRVVGATRPAMINHTITKQEPAAQKQKQQHGGGGGNTRGGGVKNRTRTKELENSITKQKPAAQKQKQQHGGGGGAITRGGGSKNRSRAKEMDHIEKRRSRSRDRNVGKDSGGVRKQPQQARRDVIDVTSTTRSDHGRIQNQKQTQKSSPPEPTKNPRRRIAPGKNPHSDESLSFSPALLLFACLPCFPIPEE